MDDLNEIKTALEARIDSFKEEMRRDIAVLNARIESRDRDIARLQGQLTDEAFSLYDIEQQISSLKSEVERSRRGW